MDYEDSDWDDDYEEDDNYGDNYGDEDDSSETIPCPACGAEIYEDAEACPQCGEYIHHGYIPGSGSPWWSFGGAIAHWSPFWIVLAVGGTISVIFALMMFSW